MRVLVPCARGGHHEDISEERDRQISRLLVLALTFCVLAGGAAVYAARKRISF